MTPKIAATRRALPVSRAVSWYSGANVAQHSIPYDDQHITYSQTITSLMPLSAVSECQLTFECRFDECQSPVMYGRNMITASGIRRSAPVTYPTHTAGRIPITLNVQITAMMTMVSAIGNEK